MQKSAVVYKVQRIRHSLMMSKSVVNDEAHDRELGNTAAAAHQTVKILFSQAIVVAPI